MTAQCGHSGVVNVQPLKVHNIAAHTRGWTTSDFFKVDFYVMKV